MRLNTRQRLIVNRLISSDSPVTLKQLSEELEISTRTVQRELKSVKKLLQQFELDLDSKTGVGVSIIGSSDMKHAAQLYLTDSDSDEIVSLDERHYRLKKMLLSLNEPVKLYYLSRQLEVSEATISNDLGKLDTWFRRHQLELVRRPGFGVMVEGEEKLIRQAILELLYEQYTKDQLVHVLQKDSLASRDDIGDQLSIWNDLFHFIEEQYIHTIERILMDLRKQHQFFMSDSAFVGIVVHIALAIQRLKAGEGIDIHESILTDLKQCKEFVWASEIADKLSDAMEVTIPESEKGYITMHLMGAHASQSYEEIKQFPAEEYIKDIVYIASDCLKLSLIDDQDLLTHLQQHLVSALFRISMHMKIRNPLLADVQTNYPEVYAAACKCSEYLEQRTGLRIPDEEVGYLAMHFGAAVLRKDRKIKKSYRVIVVCTSGFGTSRLLAAQIKKELPNVEVVAIVPLLELLEESNAWDDVDLIITTVTFDFDRKAVVEVSPFLTKEDCLKIETRLSAIQQTKLSVPAMKQESINETIQRMNRYGEAVSDILQHFQLVLGLQCKTKEEIIREAAYGALLQDPEADVARIESDLTYREKMGHWISEDAGLSLIHYRTTGIHIPVVSIYRLKTPVVWHEEIIVQSVLVLLVPAQASQEYMDMIGEISASLIETENLRQVAEGTEEQIKQHFHHILSTAYTMKAKELIGEHT